MGIEVLREIENWLQETFSSGFSTNSRENVKFNHYLFFGWLAISCHNLSNLELLCLVSIVCGVKEVFQEGGGNLKAVLGKG